MKKKAYSNHLSKWNVLKFGKHEGKRVVDVLNEDPKYVLEFLIGKLGKEIHGIDVRNELKKMERPDKNYDSSAGLIFDFCFYRDYIKSSNSKEGSVAICDKETGLIVKGKSFEECVHNMNKELEFIYGLWITT